MVFVFYSNGCVGATPFFYCPAKSIILVQLRASINSLFIIKCTIFYTFGYTGQMERRIFWIGASLVDLKKFPANAIQKAGYQLHRVQTGLEPDDWKPFNEIGSGVREIRIIDSSSTFRIMYVTKLKEGIYVLHSFQKKTQKTRKQDIDIAKTRYQAIITAGVKR